MPPIVLTIEIAHPPDEVFSYVTDPSRFSEWQEDASRGRLEGGGPPGVGSRFTTTRRIGSAERTTTSEITEITLPRSWAAHGVDGPVRPIMHVTVAPLGESARLALLTPRCDRAARACWRRTSDALRPGAPRAYRKRVQQFPKREEKGIKRRQYADVLSLLTDENARSILC